MKQVFNGHLPENLLHHYPLFETPRENEFHLMSQSILDWAKQNIDSLKLDHDKKIPDNVIKSLKEMGLFGLIIPEKYGGSELSQTMYTRILEILNQIDSSVTITIGAHSSIGLKGLYLFGSEEQKSKYMPKLASGEMIAAFALTEPGAGSDAAGIKTKAVKNSDHYIINGSKLWITNGAIADFFTVFAKEDIDGKEKISAFLVTRDMGGVTHGHEEQKLGIKASSTVEIFLKDVKVPIENMLGKPGEGFKIAMAILNQGRLGLAGGSIGAMKSVLDECISYSNNRKAFGHSVIEFDIIKNMMVDMNKYIYACEAVTYFTTNLVDIKSDDYSTEAAICKIYCTEANWKCMNIAMQMHGGNGYMVEYGIERKLRDARIGLIFEGTNEILRLFISMSSIKEIASEYQKIGKEIQSVKSLDFISDLNLAISKIGFLSDFAIQEVKKSVSSEKISGFHDSLSKEVKRLSDAVHLLSSQSSKLIRTYGNKLIDEQLQLCRLADIAINTYVIACVLSRIHTVLVKMGGVEKNANELSLAKLIIRDCKISINQSEHDIAKNRDEYVRNLGKEVSKSPTYRFSLDNRQKASSL